MEGSTGHREVQAPAAGQGTGMWHLATGWVPGLRPPEHCLVSTLKGLSHVYPSRGPRTTVGWPLPAPDLTGTVASCAFGDPAWALANQHFLSPLAETGGICIAPRPAEEGAEILPGMAMRPFFGILPTLMDEKVRGALHRLVLMWGLCILLLSLATCQRLLAEPP